MNGKEAREKYRSLMLEAPLVAATENKKTDDWDMSWHHVLIGAMVGLTCWHPNPFTIGCAALSLLGWVDVLLMKDRCRRR